MFIEKNYSFYCWFSFILKKNNRKKQESIFISSINFWLPSKTWSSLRNKNMFKKKNTSLIKTIVSLNCLFNLFFSNSFFFFYTLPKKGKIMTLSKGPMVRKKQSREQSGSIYCFNKIDIFFTNFFNLFLFKTMINSLFFVLFLQRLTIVFIKLLDLLLFQQLKYSVYFFVTSLFFLN